MSAPKRAIIPPLIIITVGIAWLLNELQWIPSIDWLWTIALAGAGALTLLSGVNKMAFVIGLFLLVSSAFSILRQTGRITLPYELPALIITLGLLLLIAELLPLPVAALPKGREKYP